MTEVRARQGVCQGERWCGVLVRAPIHTHPHPYADRRCPPAAGECTTYHCYKGGPPEPPEGLESEGCPLYSHPAQLTDNRNCVLCMECVKACPNRCAAYMRRAGRGACSRAASLAHGAAVGAPPPPTHMCVHCMRPPASCPRAAPRRSVEFRWRLPGVDLWTTHKATSSELSLMFMLLGAGGDGGRAQAEAGGGGGGATAGACSRSSRRRPPHVRHSLLPFSLPRLHPWHHTHAVYLHHHDAFMLQLGLDPELFTATRPAFILNCGAHPACRLMGTAGCTGLVAPVCCHDPPPASLYKSAHAPACTSADHGGAWRAGVGR